MKQEKQAHPSPVFTLISGKHQCKIMHYQQYMQHPLNLHL